MSITLYKKGAIIPNDQNSVIVKDKLAEIIPLDYILDWFKARMNKTGPENRILVLKASTGSGKSTALPPAIYKEFCMKSGDNIIVTEPRVLTAISIVKDQILGGPYYPYLRLGKNIGWITGITKKRAISGINYATTGVLLMQLNTMTDEEIINKYKFIIIDEVHEASNECISVLFLLKRLMARNVGNVGMPFIILTSATLEEDKYLGYFGLKSDKPGDLGDREPNLIKVAGLSYPRKVVFLPDRANFPNYFEAMNNTVEEIHLRGVDDNPKMADILLFLPGASEIKKVRALLLDLVEKLHKDKKPVFYLLTINSEVVAKDSDEFAALTHPLSELKVEIGGKELEPIRRVILATVVAEVGITIDTLKYVIDCGYHRAAIFNPIWGVGGLITEPAPQSRIIQRIGRVGRKFPGEYYGMFTESAYKLLQNNQLSDPQISDASLLVLNVINSMPEFKLETFDLLDGPTIDGIQYAFEKLFTLGMIGPRSPPEKPGWKSTFLGQIALKLPKIPIEARRLILGAPAWGISIIDAVSIVAYLNINYKDWAEKKSFTKWSGIYKLGLPEYFARKLPEKLEKATYDKYRLIIADEFIEGIILFNAVKKIVETNKLGQTFAALKTLCAQAQIPYETMQKFLNARDEIYELTIMAGISPFENKTLAETPENEFMNKITALKHLIYESYRLNFATYVSGHDKYGGRAGILISPPQFTAIRKYDPAQKPKKHKKGGQETVVFRPAQEAEFGPENEENQGISGSSEQSAPGPKLVVPFHRPKYIIFENTHMFKYDPAKNIYTIEAGRISILDGYVNPDKMFGIPSAPVSN